MKAARDILRWYTLLDIAHNGTHHRRHVQPRWCLISYGERVDIRTIRSVRQHLQFDGRLPLVDHLAAQAYERGNSIKQSSQARCLWAVDLARDHLCQGAPLRAV